MNDDKVRGTGKDLSEKDLLGIAAGEMFDDGERVGRFDPVLQDDSFCIIPHLPAVLKERPPDSDRCQKPGGSHGFARMDFHIGIEQYRQVLKKTLTVSIGRDVKNPSCDHLFGRLARKDLARKRQTPRGLCPQPEDHLCKLLLTIPRDARDP